MDPGREPAIGTPNVAARYLPALDGLRALAIAAVVWHHSLPCAFPGWLGRGHAGVPLFFALSGFLITRLLCAERHTTGDIALARFWVRRSLRIFPLYYAVLCGFVLYLSCVGATDATRHFFANLPYYATYTSNWFVDFDVRHAVWFGFAWSLATEEQFYLWWPPLLRASKRRWPLAALALALVLGADQLAEHGAQLTGLAPAGSASRIGQSASAAMLLGALLALGLAEPCGRLARVFASPHALGLTLLLAGAWLWQPVGPPIVLDAAFAAVVAAAALWDGNGLAGRVLVSSPLRHVGRVSYGIYLFHVPVIGLLKRAFPALVERPWALFPLAFGLAFGLAALSYRHVEAPLLALRERFRSQPAAGAAQAAPHGTDGPLGWVREG